MKIDTKIIVDEINKNISEYPYPASDYIRGLRRAIEIISGIAYRKEVRKSVKKAEIKLQEREDDPKTPDTPGFYKYYPRPENDLNNINWLLLPSLRLYLNVNNIRSIGLDRDETSVRVYFLSGEGIDYFGDDFKAIWDYAEKRRISDDL